MHQPKVEFIKKKKNHQPKLDVQRRIKILPKERERERERERESIHLFVWENMDWMKERKENIHSKLNGEKKSQNKSKMKG